MTKLALIGVPYSGGGPDLGSHLGPQSFRDNNIVSILTETPQWKDKFDVVDYGDIAIPDNRDNIENYIFRRVRDKSNEAYDTNRIPVVLGGDHTVALGNIITSVENYDNLGLIWIDAHPDLNVPLNSVTGNTHGMVLSKATGIDYSFEYSTVFNNKFVSTNNTILIGTSSIDDFEQEQINEYNIELYPPRYIHTFGIPDTVKSIAKKLVKNNVENIHISLDLDVLSSLFYPGVTTPVEGLGLNHYDIKNIIYTLGTYFDIVGMDVVELTPPKDFENVTVKAAIDIIVGGLGGLDI